MLKYVMLFALLALAAFVAAEPEPEPVYGAYGYAAPVAYSGGYYPYAYGGSYYGGYGHHY